VNVLLVSQCEKRALTETRRILDQFGERRGDRTWQTPITRDGLSTLRKLLRKTARKNTAVACHWIRGLDHTELLWIVGDASRFNAQGTVPTNTSDRDVLRHKDEDDWHAASIIGVLARMAALWHDFGKANRVFQRKLSATYGFSADAYRHEWVSLRLFQAFVGNDADERWLERLQALRETRDSGWLARLQCDGAAATTEAFAAMPMLARAIGWLIVSHHRLPVPCSLTSITRDELAFDRLWISLSADWCSARMDATLAEKADCWRFEHGLPDTSRQWLESAAHLAARMRRMIRPLLERDWLRDPYVAHLARLALMLADHQYSSEGSSPGLGDPHYLAYANTDGDGKLKQRLDEHLIGVANHARQIVRDLPQMERCFGRLARHRGFARRSTDDRFRWQDRAYDIAVALRARSADHGFFGVNMASTGCGKTLANGRIMYGLAHAQRGARFCVALGLRTLTLQTGDAYRDRLGLSDDDMAVMIGSSAVRGLHDAARNDEALKSRARGSSSAQPLIDDQVHVRFEGATPPGAFGNWFKRADPKLVKLLSAPVLVCTVDHLMPACESIRGGHQIAPILRLLSSDLVLDEPDDFDLADLPALTRLVHFAGLFGARLLLSSATLAPALVQGLFAAYCAGRRDFQNNRGRPGTTLNICCAWFDEYKSTQSDHANEEAFAIAHVAFVENRLRHIARQNEVRRTARIVSVPIAPENERVQRRAFAKLVHGSIIDLHQSHHETDPTTGKRASIGLVRMANIDPLIDISKLMLSIDSPQDLRIHLCVYHSRFPLLLRSRIEGRLDRLLARHHPNAIFADEQLRHILDTSIERDHIFVVLASPVAEVGRDHDYDWAVVEPSSMRSIIQLAGRVRRHRAASVTCDANILLLDRNWRNVREPQAVAFRYPGFESEHFKLRSHRLTDLLLPVDFSPLTAAPRIATRAKLNPRENLVDLEHERLALRMLDRSHLDTRNVRGWWQSATHLTAYDQRQTPFRVGQTQHNFILLPDDNHAAGWRWIWRDHEGVERPAQQRFTNLERPETGRGKALWNSSDYLPSLVELADSQQMDLDLAARRYGSVQLPAFSGKGLLQGGEGNPSSWCFDAALGLRRNQD